MPSLRSRDDEAITSSCGFVARRNGELDVALIDPSNRPPTKRGWPRIIDEGDRDPIERSGFDRVQVPHLKSGTQPNENKHQGNQQSNSPQAGETPVAHNSEAEGDTPTQNAKTQNDYNKQEQHDRETRLREHAGRNYRKANRGRNSETFSPASGTTALGLIQRRHVLESLRASPAQFR